MIQSSQQTDFAAEASGRLLVVKPFIAEELDGDSLAHLGGIIGLDERRFLDESEPA